MDTKQKPVSEKSKFVIWVSDPDFDDWKEDLAADYPDMSEDELQRLMYELNNDQLDNERDNLKHLIPDNGIFAIAELGLWHGKKQAVLERKPESVADCLTSYVRGQSEVEFYVDHIGDLRITESHHDGTNHYLFRAWKPDVTEKQKSYLQLKAFLGQDCTNSMKRLTYRLGDLIGDVYGWSFPHRPKDSKPIPVPVRHNKEV